MPTLTPVHSGSGLRLSPVSLHRPSDRDRDRASVEKAPLTRQRPDALLLFDASPLRQQSQLGPRS